MTARLNDRRQYKRTNIRLPVFLDNASGVTRDVSRTGVFLWTNGTYDLGESIGVSMGRTTKSRKFMLRCRGVVFRTEPHGNQVGVALLRITRRFGGRASVELTPYTEHESPDRR
jgi:hypothetical protein